MSKLVCYDCGAEHGEADAGVRCGCGGLLAVEHDFAGADAERLKRTFAERLSERRGVYASGVWRYKELICPDLPDDAVVTRGEGNTGLYRSSALEKRIGVRELWFKTQSDNPSGSFKDNGMTVAVSRGVSLGYGGFVCASTGNTSSSLAMYAAWAGREARVLVPKEDVSANKVLQTLAYGAKLIEFDGGYDDGIRFLERHGRELGLYVCNSINPYRIEGQKSIVYELAQSLDWRLPDWIVVPGGALSNVTALGKGLSDLKALGFIGRMPRVALVQAEGASPFHAMMEANAPALTPFGKPSTVASAMNIGNPPSWKKAREFLNDHGGTTCAVSDGEILEAKAWIDRAGIGCEPASASTVAGLRKLIAAGTIGKDETVACVLTGHVLKDTDVLRPLLETENGQRRHCPRLTVESLGTLGERSE